MPADILAEIVTCTNISTIRAPSRSRIASHIEIEGCKGEHIDYTMKTENASFVRDTATSF